MSRLIGLMVGNSISHFIATAHENGSCHWPWVKMALMMLWLQFCPAGRCGDMLYISTGQRSVRVYQSALNSSAQQWCIQGSFSNISIYVLRSESVKVHMLQ